MAGLGHILFNMLPLWMFGTDLERTWGTRFFTKYLFITGLGAAATTLLVSISPLSRHLRLDDHRRIRRDYGVLVAYGIYFPHRTVCSLIFPIPARVLRDDLGRDCLPLIGGLRWRRRRAQGASRWIGGRLSLP